MTLIIDQAGNVLMWSEAGSPTPGAGETAVVLTTDQEAAFEARPANGGITFVNGQFAFAPLPPPPAPAKNQILLGMSQEMSNWAATNPSGTSVQLAQHMADWAAANA